MGVKPEEFVERVQLEKSACVVDEEHFFIRGQILLPILETEDHFIWSVWCSLSEKSFQHTMERWNDPDRDGDHYFGWLCTSLDTYEQSTIHLKTNVVSRKVGTVPVVWLQHTDHPLYLEQQEGITIARWHEIVHQMLHEPTKGS
jgi:hypothetical protein